MLEFFSFPAISKTNFNKNKTTMKLILTSLVSALILFQVAQISIDFSPGKPNLRTYALAQMMELYYTWKKSSFFCEKILRKPWQVTGWLMVKNPILSIHIKLSTNALVSPWILFWRFNWNKPRERTIILYLVKLVKMNNLVLS